MELELSFKLSGHRIVRKIAAPKITYQKITLPAAATDVPIDSSGFSAITQAVFAADVVGGDELEVAVEIGGVPVVGHIGCAVFPGVDPGTIVASNSGVDELLMHVVLAGE